MMLLRLLRMAGALARWRVPLLPSVIGRAVRFCYSCEISYLADIDPTARFPHKALGVVIADHVRVGARTRILQNSTIGGRSGHPTTPIVGADVLIGAGACVIGPVVVGDGATIGANAVVLCDVPPGHTAVGIPARILPPPGKSSTERVVDGDE